MFGLLIAGVLTVNLSANAQNYVTNMTSVNGQFVTNVSGDGVDSQAQNRVRPGFQCAKPNNMALNPT